MLMLDCSPPQLADLPLRVEPKHAAAGRGCNSKVETRKLKIAVIQC